MCKRSSELLQRPPADARAEVTSPSGRFLCAFHLRRTSASFGAFNFNYAATGRLGELRDARGYLQDPRIVQFGFRVEF